MIRKNNSRKSKKIDSGSMADIAFLLLIFFLVATTIREEKGIPTTLSPYHPYQKSINYDYKNAFLDVYINANGSIMIDKIITKQELIKSFLSESIEKNLRQNKKTIINITHDRSTKYKAYLSFLNEVEVTFNELWQKEAIKTYNKDYINLSKKEKFVIIKKTPKLISDKEPTDLKDEIVLNN